MAPLSQTLLYDKFCYRREKMPFCYISAQDISILTILTIRIDNFLKTCIHTFYLCQITFIYQCQKERLRYFTFEYIPFHPSLASRILYITLIFVWAKWTMFIYREPTSSGMVAIRMVLREQKHQGDVFPCSASPTSLHVSLSALTVANKGHTFQFDVRRVVFYFCGHPPPKNHSSHVIFRKTPGRFQLRNTLEKLTTLMEVISKFIRIRGLKLLWLRGISRYVTAKEV